MTYKKANKLHRILTVSVLCLTLVLSAAVPSAQVFAAASGSAAVFDNTGKGEDAISLTEARSFQVKVKITDMKKADLEQAVKSGKVSWTLSRTKGMQDETMFPYQFLGGPLTEWSTVETAIQPKQPMFTNIKNTVLETDGLALQLTFDSKSLLGYNGIDGRDRKLSRNTILDYTGEYVLTCKIGNAVKGTAVVQVRPYDSFKTQSQINSELDALAARANKAGLYAKVETIGKTAENRPIKAIFLTAKEKDLSDYLALTERAETDPAALQSAIDKKTLQYKVPILYSNIHADEIIGSDACIDFLETIVGAAEGNGKIPYDMITGLTGAGKTQLQKEMADDGIVWSKLIQDKVTGMGYIQGNGVFEPTDAKPAPEASVDLTADEMKQYYNMEQKELNVSKVLNDVFFIVVPSENVDGKTALTRTNGNYFDLNRDNTFQTQSETQAMTQLIAKWNPVAFYEIHGFYTQFQVEPCSPTHEPNAEYDLFMDTALAQGEYFGAAAISNNEKLNSFQMPMRDYLTVDKSGNKKWIPFDDMSTSYTPQYSFLHGTCAYTVEVSYGSQDAVDAIQYGFIGNADFVSANKDRIYKNQLEFFRRGLNNIDADTIRPYYVSQSDEIGAEADVFRKKYAENNNFFPEYYVIPIDSSDQRNTQAAKDMISYLLRNDVRLKQLSKDVTVNGTDYKKGTVIVDMHQAKRNMANAALYSDIVITDWDDLYSEPLTAFPQLRGFDVDVITKTGAFQAADMTAVTTVPGITTAVAGKGDATILENNSVDAVKAVNALLKAGKSVGLITEGKNKGDFLMATKDFASIKDNYVLIATATAAPPAAKKIAKAPKLYVPGKTASPFETIDGAEYGVRNYSDRLNTNLGWDLFAYGKQLGFELADSAASADVIVGSRGLSDAEKAEVSKGKPYVGYTAMALDSVKDMGISLEYQKGGIFDALTTVAYVEDSLITAPYVGENDNIMYGYGGNYITKAPEGAKVLIKTTSDYPIEGFMAADYIPKYQNQVQAIDYVKGKYNITLFANTMTNKAHQQDDYRYVTNAIYSKLLGGDFTVSTGFSEVVMSKQKIKLNGQAMELQLYNVDGYNYVKLRDVAYALKDTADKFSVATAAGNKIAAVPGGSYTPVGGEMAKGADLSKTCAVSKWTILVNDEPKSLSAYNIGGYNYFMLRNLGELFDFGVDYDKATNTALITAN